ncbi:MAG: copper chaperone PCu(A)C [Mycobacteriales bacterium]
MSRRPVTVAAVVLSAVVLSGCGTGLHAQTYRETGRSDSAVAEVGSIAVRGLHVEPSTTGNTLAVGDDAVVTGVLVNNGTEDDSLTGAATDAASSIAIQQGGVTATSVKVPAGSTSGTDWSLKLSGLTKELQAGEYLSITLVFDKAGRTTLQVPIRAGDNGLSSRTPEQDPYKSEG